MNMNNTTQFRLWADGDVTHEDDFDEQDTQMEVCGPIYDDYQLVDVPDEIIFYIEDNMRETMTISKTVKTKSDPEDSPMWVHPTANVAMMTFDTYAKTPLPKHTFAHDLPNPSEYRGGDYGKDEEVAS
tara:strand:+ start:566 stop:949 length:384 start_codon:yes stop_codon:yes gene_type:complete